MEVADLLKENSHSLSELNVVGGTNKSGQNWESCSELLVEPYYCILAHKCSERFRPDHDNNGGERYSEKCFTFCDRQI